MENDAIITETIKPLILKNDKERLNFLDSYQSWPIIAKVQYLGLTIYQYKFFNGVSVLAFCTTRKYPPARYQLYTEDKTISFNYLDYHKDELLLDWASPNFLVEYFKHNKNILEGEK